VVWDVPRFCALLRGDELLLRGALKALPLLCYAREGALLDDAHVKAPHLHLCL